MTTPLCYIATCGGCGTGMSVPSGQPAPTRCWYCDNGTTAEQIATGHLFQVPPLSTDEADPTLASVPNAEERAA